MITWKQPATAKPAVSALAAAGTATTRLVFADNLRVLLTALVIIHHLAVTYGAFAAWYYVEIPQETLTPTVTVMIALINQAFFMGCFFLIAGYFTPGAVDRKGLRAWMRDRLVRLGVPLLCYAFVLNPVLSYVGYSTLPEEIRGPLVSFGQFYPLTMGPGPLWFVEALIMFSLGYAIWRRLTGTTAPRPAAEAARPLAYGSIVAFTLLLAGATFLLRLVVPIGMYIPIVGFPSASHLPQYVGLFVVGIVAYRHNWLQRLPARAAGVGLGAALAATILLFPVAFSDGPAIFLGGANVPAAVYAVWEAIFCVGMCLGLVALFSRRFNRQGRLGQFLSAQAYAVYVIHAVVVVAVAMALRGLDVFPLVKWALAIPISLVFCWVGAYLVRQLPGARRVL
jgi:hypothetical protein